MRLGWTLACALLGACSPFGGGAFTCTDDSQCVLGGMPGTCQSTGMCSFSDPNCGASGQRYGAQAGSLSNTCVGDTPLIDAALIDLPPADTLAATIDALCIIAGLDFCHPGLEPGGPMMVGTDDAIDTDHDPRCRTYAQSGGPDACLLVVSSLEIASGVKLVATGNRPLIIASSSDITISGLLDVSSHNGQHGAGATSDDCNHNATNASNNDKGASGGAGGSFATVGGDSGIGNTDADTSKGETQAAASKHGDVLALPGFARGGCKGLKGGGTGIGGNGDSGDPGGSVWLYANGTIDVMMAGTISAGGEGGGGGGFNAGGGGAGTGGFIRLMAENIVVMGSLAANGGGGGQGGKTPAVQGQDGGNGKTDGHAASGGSGGGPLNGGNGGNGSTNGDGQAGSDSTVGAGGGGAGAGYIVLLGTRALEGSTISPPAM